MTHNGGQQHAVGYTNQQFEVSVFDEAANARRVVGWTNDSAAAGRMKDSAELRPGWRFGWVTDLHTDISHTKDGPWIGERPMPSRNQPELPPFRDEVEKELRKLRRDTNDT